MEKQKYNAFHYVRTATGTISGASVLQQTEDAINDLADYTTQSNINAEEALRIAKIAEANSTLALSTANTALSTANSALAQVDTLTKVVEAWDARITEAEANAQTAVTTANEANAKSEQAIETSKQADATSKEALKKAKQAVATSEQAETKAEQAVSTANQANATANEAKEIAKQAQIDAEADLAEMNRLLTATTEKANEAKTSAQDSAASASQSEAHSEMARRWAVETETPVDAIPNPDGTDQEIDLYGARYYAEQAAKEANKIGTAVEDAKKAAESAKQSETNATQAAQTATQAAEQTAQNAQSAQADATRAEEAADRAEAAASNATDVVKYVQQDLNLGQKEQARKNIDAAGVSGNLGTFTAYTTCYVDGATSSEFVVSKTSPDASETPRSIRVYDGDKGDSWTKIVRLTGTNQSIITNGLAWKWANAINPIIMPGGFAVFCWCGSAGIIFFHKVNG